MNYNLLIYRDFVKVREIFIAFTNYENLYSKNQPNFKHRMNNKSASGN